MKVTSYINGQRVEGEGESIPVDSPLNGKIIGEVSLLSTCQFDDAVATIKHAQMLWGNQTFKKRTEVIFRLRELLAMNKDRLAEVIVRENGKTADEAAAEVLKAIELCEFAVSIPALISGRTQFVSAGIDVKEYNQPLGIIASITPFNFPLMVPMWTIPNILVCGNAMVLKPSEKTPRTVLILAELLEEAGLPKGVFNVVQGSREIVEAICDHPDIGCVTFVGSTPIAKVVYRRATYNFKRALCLGGAKNHILVTDEVNAEQTAKEILAAAYGMSGQRCMAASVVLAIGNSDKLIDEIVRQSKEVVLGKTMNPLISKEAVSKVETFLEETSGEILVDGRTFENTADRHGYYIGPSVVLYDRYAGITTDEVFAPTLEIIRCETLEAALEYQNQSPFANGASIYTEYGEYATEASQRLSSGMIGVNIGVPVPRDPFSFGGLKESKFGVGDITGYNSLPLFTQCKKITTKWNIKHKKDWMS